MYCKKVVMEDNVWIGNNVVISVGVTVGWPSRPSWQKRIPELQLYAGRRCPNLYWRRHEDWPECHHHRCVSPSFSKTVGRRLRLQQTRAYRQERLDCYQRHRHGQSGQSRPGDWWKWWGILRPRQINSRKHHLNDKNKWQENTNAETASLQTIKKRSHLRVTALFHCLLFFCVLRVKETIWLMCIDETSCLQIRLDGRRADKFHAALFEVFG